MESIVSRFLFVALKLLVWSWRCSKRRYEPADMMAILFGQGRRWTSKPVNPISVAISHFSEHAQHCNLEASIPSYHLQINNQKPWKTHRDLVWKELAAEFAALNHRIQTYKTSNNSSNLLPESLTVRPWNFPSQKGKDRLPTIIFQGSTRGCIPT